jgi:hypothetical protein
MLRLPRSKNGNTEVVIFGTNITIYTRDQFVDSDSSIRKRIFVEDGNHGNGGWEVHELTFEEVVQLVDKHIKESK